MIEMLVVIGIIALLIGVSIGGFSSMTRTAEKARAQELVNNVATALTALYQQEGNWPKRLATNGQTDGRLDKDAAIPLALGKYFSLTTKEKYDSKTGKNTVELVGLDRFGIVSPWATAVIKRRGTSASLSDVVLGTKTVQDHILHYALDLDGDGVIKGASVGGKTVDIRATAAVWCAGRDGVVDPYLYGSGGGKKGSNQSTSGKRSDDIYSWTPGQTSEVR